MRIRVATTLRPFSAHVNIALEFNPPRCSAVVAEGGGVGSVAVDHLLPFVSDLFHRVRLAMLAGIDEASGNDENGSFGGSSSTVRLPFIPHELFVEGRSMHEASCVVPRLPSTNANCTSSGWHRLVSDDQLHADCQVFVIERTSATIMRHVREGYLVPESADLPPAVPWHVFAQSIVSVPLRAVRSPPRHRVSSSTTSPSSSPPVVHTAPPVMVHSAVSPARRSFRLTRKLVSPQRRSPVASQRTLDSSSSRSQLHHSGTVSKSPAVSPRRFVLSSSYRL